MHPAKSVIFFTTASGAGYGLIALMSVLAIFGVVPESQSLGFLTFLIGYGLVTAGLLSSTFHLGHPERAWRAMSQWRSSWLSREGVAALLTYIPTGLFAIGWVFLGKTDGVFALFGLIGAVCCAVTVFTTAMIYASLKTIHAWYNVWTKVNYLVLAAMTGAVLIHALGQIWGLKNTTSLAVIALVMLATGLVVKGGYWRFLRTTRSDSTSASATGLGGATGRVTMLDPPHGGSNYLLDEMGFQIARKHASKLRRIVFIAAYIVPFVLIALGLFLGTALSLGFAILAVIAAGIGVAVERWLFFAEARHTVMLYYGAETA